MPGTRSRWLNYNHWVSLIPISITTVGLYGSVVVESIRLSDEDNEVHPIWYLIFVLRVVTLVSAVKLFSPLKISSNALQNLITKFRLKHLANVTVFYFAALYIFALIGVHEIGPLDYRCVSHDVCNNCKMPLELCWAQESDDGCNLEGMNNNTSNADMNRNADMNGNADMKNSCVSVDSLSVPDLHCKPCNDGDDCGGYACPKGFSCSRVNVGRNLGYYGHYDNLGMLI